MPLVTSTEMFKKAYEGGYAIGAFNVNNMEIIQGITEAAMEENAPLILQVSSGARNYAKHVYLMKLIEAAIEVREEDGYNIHPEIMIPLIGDVKEFEFVRDVVVKTAELVMAEKGTKIDYKVGTMIEIPRAALTADEIAEKAEFFSFGTNDLTQMTYGFSRDDAAKFLSAYYDNKVMESDPFAKLDQKGVGRLVQMAAQLGRKTRPDIKLGICGEHGGDPSSVEFCHKVGLNYVSCSPFRVPIARLAAAHAAIKEKMGQL